MYNNRRFVKIVTNDVIPETYEYNYPIDMDQMDDLVLREIDAEVMRMDEERISDLMMTEGMSYLHNTYLDYFDEHGHMPEKMDHLIAFILYRTYQESIRPTFNLEEYMVKRTQWMRAHQLE